MFTGVRNVGKCILNILAQDVIIDHEVIDVKFTMLHKITDTNNVLHQIGEITSPACLLCEMHVNTTEN